MDEEPPLVRIGNHIIAVRLSRIIAADPWPKYESSVSLYSFLSVAASIPHPYSLILCLLSVLGISLS